MTVTITTTKQITRKLGNFHDQPNHMLVAFLLLATALRMFQLLLLLSFVIVKHAEGVCNQSNKIRPIIEIRTALHLLELL